MTGYPRRETFTRLLGSLMAIGCLSLPTQAADDDWIDLLSGKTLKAWRGYRATEVPKGWVINDGILSLVSRDGDLITREQFGDFDLRFEWKINPGGNSGVKYFVSEKAQRSHSLGPEYQLIDRASLPTDVNPKSVTGALYALYAPAKEVTQTTGEWYSGRIHVDRGRIRHWLNDSLIVDALLDSDDWKSRLAKSKFAEEKNYAAAPRGHISLQDHGVGSQFRAIKIRPLQD